MGITLGDYNLLRELREKNDQTMGALAEVLEVSPAWVTGLVDRLEKLGLVRRTRSETDRRCITISLEREGYVRHEQARTLIKEFLYSKTAKISTAELENMIALLNKIENLITIESNEQQSNQVPKQAI